MDEVRRVLTEHDPTITFLCSPNNPTGMVETEETVRAVAELAPGLVVVDEAYGQFAPWSALELVDDTSPIVVTRTYPDRKSTSLNSSHAYASRMPSSALKQKSLHMI